MFSKLKRMLTYYTINFVNIIARFKLFTNKRLILIDKQGMTGSKMEMVSIAYSKITKFSKESAGHFDLDAELKIWIGSDPTPVAYLY